MILGLLTGLLAAPQGPSFEQDVLPILQTHCFSCHANEENGGPRRPKGGLRLDGAGWIRSGAGGEAVLVPGYPEDSVLYELVSLPADDGDRMPPKTDPLPAEAQQLLHDWIDAGASFGNWEGAPGGEAKVSTSAEAGTRKVPLAIRELEAIAATLKPAAAPAIEEARASGASITPLHLESPLLRAGFAAREAETGDAALEALLPIRNHLTHLDLSRTAVTDASLATLARFPHLVSLDLGRTKIGSQELGRLAGLEHLRVLNLHGTRVDDDAVKALAGFGHLRSLYLWDARLSPDGLEEVARSLPRTRVVGRLELPAPSPAPRDRD